MKQNILEPKEVVKSIFHEIPVVASELHQVRLLIDLFDKSIELVIKINYRRIVLWFVTDITSSVYHGVSFLE